MQHSLSTNHLQTVEKQEIHSAFPQNLKLNVQCFKYDKDKV